jgi:asparagine synthase (glutamine-hydrolysing)
VLRLAAHFARALVHLPGRETYDVTTTRAGTPMFLLARKIKAMGIKMVMSGEGADELFGGYLYFHKAPNAQEFHAENVAKLQDLHLYDCLRANKAMAAWGVEARVPFLDREVLDYNLSFDAADKMCVDEHGQRRPEKSIIRQAFDTPENPYLPHDVLWRQKEQFSDGVGQCDRLARTIRHPARPALGSAARPPVAAIEKR